MKQYTIYALIALLFTCLSGLKQDYKPITFKHHFDASISEFLFEFDTLNTNFKIPKPPNFNNIEAKKTEPIVEAST